MIVTEEGGGPIEAASVMVRGETYKYLGAKWLRTDEEGRLDVPTLGVAMSVTVGSKRHEYRELGPWEPGQVPEMLNVELVPKPLVSGIVMANGAPVAGATVEACQACLDFSETFVPVTAGFPMRLFGVGQKKEVTDEEGRFQLVVDKDWTQCVLLTSAEGWATSEESIDLGSNSDSTALELELKPGGRLVGELRTPDGRSQADVVVAISRGDGKPRSTRTDEAGRYAFEHLTPGSWRVESRETEPAFEVMAVSPRGHDAFRWDCEVVEGETTVFDLDERHLLPIEFEGLLRIGGVPAAGWSARVILPDYQVSSGELPATVLDDLGGFRFEVPPGTYELELRSPDGEPTTFLVYRNFEAEGGPFRWQEDVAIGACEGAVADGPARLSLFHGNTRRAPLGAG